MHVQGGGLALLLGSVPGGFRRLFFDDFVKLQVIRRFLPENVDFIKGCANLRSDYVHDISVERPGRNRIDVKKGLSHPVHAVRIGRLDEPIRRVDDQVDADEFLETSDALVARRPQDDG